jgi:hypothetical protein
MRAALFSTLFMGLVMSLGGLAMQQSAWADEEEETEEVRHCYCCHCEGCDPRYCDCAECDCCNE